MEVFVNQSDSSPAVSSYTDDNGNFYLNGAPPGSFWVKVSLGGRYEWKPARLNGDVVDPTPLVVAW